MSDIFSSKAKFVVLKLLVQYVQPIPLRTIAALTGLPIRSTVLALQSLLKQKIICDSRVNQNRLFQLNQKSIFYEELKKIFFHIEKSEIEMRARTHQPEAAKAFKFAESAHRFFSASK